MTNSSCEQPTSHQIKCLSRHKYEKNVSKPFCALVTEVMRFLYQLAAQSYQTKWKLNVSDHQLVWQENGNRLFMFNTHTGPPETSLILYFHVCLGSVIFYNVTFDKCLWIIIVHRHVQTVHGFLTSMCCNITTRIKYMKISNLTQI